MLSSTAISNINDTEFKNAQASFQNGDWENGLSLLNSLVERYPEMPELREFQQEMLLRSRMDEYEREERRRYLGKRLLYWGSRVGAIVIILGLLAWGLNTYSSWLQSQWNNVRQSVLQEVQTLDTSVKFRNAQNFLGAGRPEDALALLGEIEEQDSDFPGLAEMQAEASKNAEVEQKYNTRFSDYCCYRNYPYFFRNCLCYRNCLCCQNYHYPYLFRRHLAGPMREHRPIASTKQ